MKQSDHHHPCFLQFKLFPQRLEQLEGHLYLIFPLPKQNKTKPNQKRKSTLLLHFRCLTFHSHYSSMAHRPNQRRNLAAPESNPSSMDSAPAKHPKPTTTTIFTATPSHHPTPNPDLTQASNKPSFMVKHFSSLNLSHKVRAPHKQSLTNHPLIDTHLQAKAMTASAIVDSSKFSLLKPKSLNTRLAPKVEKEGKPAKITSKEKPRKSTTELERRKLHGVMKNEKKDSNGGLNSGILIEDVKIDKSRNPLVEEYGDVKRPSVSLAPSGGRRRSFCGSQVDLGDVFAINGAKVISADMPPFMQIHAVDCARKAFDSMEKFTSKTLAFALKKEFDGVYGPAWQCIVGSNFGSFVTHSAGGFLYFSMDKKLYILLFKTAVQKAD